MKNNYSRHQRGNEDELDDIDDWNEHEDGDNGAGSAAGLVPSQSELIQAKRKRREQRGDGGALFDDDDDHNGRKFGEADTSLAKDGVKIEPFHMREEETDGTGYFDGDTYVFRRNVPAEDGEADAWADTLMRDGDDNDDEDNNFPAIGIAKNIKEPSAVHSATMQEDLDELSKEQLYKRIVPLIMGDGRESIMRAIQRYGKLAKTKNSKKTRRNQQKQQHQETNYDNHIDNDKAGINVAKSHLDDLTGTANALLLKGEVDIYETTREDIFRKFPSLSDQLGSKKNSIDNGTVATVATTSKGKWEYQGNEDNQLHMVTTEQMIAWVRSGYFVGAQRVRIRTVIVQEGKEEPKQEKAEPSLSTQDDMLADLMDDDDDEEEENRPAKKARESEATTTSKGEWMWSDEVDYQKYL